MMNFQDLSYLPLDLIMIPPNHPIDCGAILLFFRNVRIITIAYSQHL